MLQEKMNAEELYNDAFGMLSADTLMSMAITIPDESLKLSGGDRQTMVLETFKNLVLRREVARKAARAAYSSISVEEWRGAKTDGI